MAIESVPKRRKLWPSREGHSGSRDCLISLEDTDTAFTPTDRTSVLTRSISPPAFKRERNVDLAPSEQLKTIESPNADTNDTKAAPIERRRLSSPIQLTHVEGLPSANNIDTVKLEDILGDPLIKECWVFNYLFDVDFLMSKLDQDVRDDVHVKIVHGSWKRDDSNKLHIDDAVSRWKNIQAITAYMPEAFGTHHSKMVILIRHDDHAQINILTANIVPGDWAMCQAVWRSPLLPLQDPTLEEPDESQSPATVVGSGGRFKFDLLNYLRAYGRAKLEVLIAQLKQYDFRCVKAALVASTPGKQNTRSSDPESESLWGWPGLKNILKRTHSTPSKTPSIIVIQVSSVASLGAGDKWLTSTLLDALAATKPSNQSAQFKPKSSLIFPTADEIRRSIRGYSSGGSIHMKTQTATQAKQLDYLRPMLCHWASDTVPRGLGTTSTSVIDTRKAGRGRAAPHIKTYIRFSDESMTSIDWAMMTSANLSTQAWGATTNTIGEVRVCSYEIGVVVWPALWDDGSDGSVNMVPVFKKDMPERSKAEGSVKTSVGMRMPYDLPLTPYTRHEMPWCATAPDAEVDWMGRAWPGFGAH